MNRESPKHQRHNHSIELLFSQIEGKVIASWRRGFKGGNQGSLSTLSKSKHGKVNLVDSSVPR